MENMSFTVCPFSTLTFSHKENNEIPVSKRNELFKNTAGKQKARRTQTCKHSINTARLEKLPAVSMWF